MPIRLRLSCFALSGLLAASCASAQSDEPFPSPIGGTTTPVRVGIAEFATIPDSDGAAARMMLMLDEPGTRRLFVNDMRGLLYSVSYDGRTVMPYLDIRAPRWNVPVQSSGNERGFQSFAFHPQFSQQGAPGFGKFYTYLDTSNQDAAADFGPSVAGARSTHDTVLLEWTATNPGASSYDGGPPRELIRLRQPFTNHNAGHLSFNPLAKAGSPDEGLLYMGVADGGSAGDPMKMAQNLGSAFGKIFRIAPLGNNSTNKKYGVPSANPFAADNSTATLGEIYAYGVRNPQRFGWDPRTGNMYVADIGQNMVEEVSQVTRGSNLGWNDWEGSYRFLGRGRLDLTQRRWDPKMTYPVVEFDHNDALFSTGLVAITGLIVYRSNEIPQLSNMMLFGDNPSGEVLAINADGLPSGGQDRIRRVMFNDGGVTRTFLQIVQAKTVEQKRDRAARADLRFGTGPNNQVFLLNKYDGIIRVLTR